MKKPKLLITGGSGNFGKVLTQLAKERFNVFATYNQHEMQLNNISFIQADLTNKALVGLLMRTVKPDAIIHLAAATSPDYCEEHARQSLKINVEAAGFLANSAKEKNTPLFFASTDLVFNGRSENSNEETRTEPICIYGQQKLEAEQMILARCENAAVLRLPTMVNKTNMNFLGKMMQRFKEGKSMALYTDEIRSFASMQDVALGMLTAVEQQWKGTWHLGGAEALSRYDLGKIVCDKFGYDESLISPMKQYMEAGKYLAPRPRDVSLDSKKAFSHGYKPQKMDEYIG